MTLRLERNRLALLVLAAAVGCTGTALAADTTAKPAPKAPPAPAAPAPEPVAPGSPILDRLHLLGPGDVIAITVENQEQWSKLVRLYQDGTIELASPIGLVKARDLTTDELREQIRKALLTELRRPHVTVELREIYVKPKEPEKPNVKPKITILGSVGRRGEQELDQPKWLRTVLQEAGPTEKADLASVRVKLPDGTHRIIDFSRFALDGMVKDDLMIKGGEEIIVLERPSIQKPDPLRITVLGQVLDPNSFEIDGEATILEILKKAGGAKPGADLEKVKVTRPDEPGTPSLTLNIEKLMDGDTSVRYMPRRGDTITVPQKALKVFVFGEVAQPGETAIRENENVFDLWLHVRNLPSGDISKAQIVRRGPDGKPKYTPVNLRELQKKNDTKGAAIPKLQAGDALFIPHRKIKRGPMYYLNQIVAPTFLMRGGYGGGGYNGAPSTTN